SPLSAAERPRLVVVVSVDQLCYEYLVRFRGGFAADGLFLRVEKEGASFVNCHHRHAFTVTAPGHAVQLSGAYPDTNAVIGNSWFDRVSGKTIYCVADPEEDLVGPPPPVKTTEATPTPETKPADAKEKEKEEEDPTGISPRNLAVDTVGDVLKLATGGKAKVFGVAFKDRAAVLMTGHRADAAYWFHGKSGRWVTSTYYAKELPGYMRAINEGNSISQYAGQEWKLLLNSAAYQHYYPDDYPEERDPEGLGKAFPHKFALASDPKLSKQVLNSPFGNEVTLYAAGQVLVHEELGQDDVPDILAINLSSNDYVGHSFGPHSLEVQDLTYRTDRQLGEFLRFVEKQLAGKPWVLALTADHGVAPLVQYAKERGLPAARNPLGDLKVLQAKLEAHLRSELKARETDKTDKPLVQKLSENQVYLQQDHPALAGESFLLAQRITRDFLLRESAVVAAVTREQLLAGGGEGKLNAQFRRAFHPRRSGDVLFVMAPYMVPGTSCTTHGSPWQYDTHVPLLLLGPSIKPGRYERPTSPAALAATLSRLLEIESPSAAVEEPLVEAIKR
ncbi:MAG: alkaline phosphatase family protein, partial [Burkholderiaceae bacterium]